MEQKNEIIMDDADMDNDANSEKGYSSRNEFWSSCDNLHSEDFKDNEDGACNENVSDP